MTDFRCLKNQELIDKLHTLVGIEKKTTAEIVSVIAELDRRKLFLDLGHTSLFSYLTQECGYTAASAQRRIDAARMLSSVPEIKCEIESGALNLTQISVISQGLRQKKKENPKLTVDVSEKRGLLRQVRGLDLMQTQKLVSQVLDLDLQVQEKKRVQKDESLRIELTLSKEQQEKLQRARELLSHKYPHLSWAELFSVLAEELIKRRDPRREPKCMRARESAKGKTETVKDQSPCKNEAAKPAFKTKVKGSYSEAKPTSRVESGVVSETKVASDGFDIKVEAESDQSRRDKQMRSATTNLQVAMFNRNRTFAFINKRKAIALAIKREIHQRDLSCRWLNPITKQRCESRFQLELDHVKPVWAGGEDLKENLQILCRTHNQLKYRRFR